MNREIKFRAWHEGYPGKLIPEQMLYDEKPGDCLVYRNQGQPVHVMQFTGLKDMNGVEIYEGDIIQYKSYTAFKRWWSKIEEIPEIERQFAERKKDFQTHRAPIRFTDGQFMLSYAVDGSVIARGDKVNTSQTPHADCEEKWWDFEVIGNIYENSDLLEQNGI